MIDPSLLEVLGCPLEPDRPPFRLEAFGGSSFLVCTSCGYGFPIKDDIPYLLPEDAIAPEKMKELSNA
ncbi:MAG TPA: hypothetical protein VK934_09920 [Fimbriimonas sp.]|nr:hypothetical protein [Fimbriimonas sp.]